jgi:mannose-1-phosphate guanylyltransferase/mannose-6-phosphate isomerase
MGESVYPVLLAGGVGTRLWPLSRELYPKQLLKLIDDESLIQSTARRLLEGIDPDKIHVVCGAEHLDQITIHLKHIGLDPDGKILPEPCGRNTAPAILLATLKILMTEPDAVICVFPADHIIRSVDSFHSKLKEAIEIANHGFIVTFGIQPDYPETGYGYIEGGKPIGNGAFQVRRFVEKPRLQKAKIFMESGNFYWNSGMFVFKASVAVSEFKKHAGPLYTDLAAIMQNYPDINADKYATLDKISFDHAVMEKTDKAAVLPSDFGWSDIGSWKSLYDFLPKDSHGNAIEGDVIAKETENCLIVGRDRLIAANALKNLAVVETSDSVFVSDLNKSKEVRSIVEELKMSKRQESRQHPRVFYSWGLVTTLCECEDYQICRINVRQGFKTEISCGLKKMSHLSVLAGEGRIQRAGAVETVSKGQSIRLNPGEVISIHNKKNLPLEVLHVQTSLNA